MNLRRTGATHLFILLLMSAHSLRIAEAADGIISSPPYISGRGAAMGGAILPLGDDVPSALYINPANIGKLRKAEFEPLNFTIYGNSGWANGIGLNSYQVYDLNSFLPNLQAKTGTPMGAGGSVTTSFGMPGFGIGMLLQRQLYAVSNADGTVSYRTLNQFIPSLTTGFRLANGMIKFGYNLQWVNQATGSATVDPTSGTLDYNQGLAQGSAFSHNAGLSLTIPIHNLPTFNIVARNILGSIYSSSTLLSLATNPTAVPSTDPMRFDGSFSLTQKMGRGVALHLVSEYRDISNTSSLLPMQHLAFGGELAFGSKVALRGGWQQGYLSAGLGLKGKRADLSLAYYTEQMLVIGAVQGDSRFMLQYQMRAF